ncbi:hypothetical protein V5O48_009544 [Marasmius crinis-equi]|uniref:F-box domain-containing protein n=1 Tax=Marasmius crinis-equi TaxID=585013 RepID=A0ABR3FB74_9AGAR
MLLSDLPSEVLFLIIAYLDIHQIISLRQTCTRLAQITRNKGIWIDFLDLQGKTLPLRRDISESTLSAKAVEDIVVMNSLIDDLWSLPRETELRKLEPKRGECLLGLEVFLDRWVLAVYADGYLNIWDLAQEDGTGCRWAYTRMVREKCTSYVASFDPGTLRLSLGTVALTMAPIRQTAVIYEIQLSERSHPVFKFLRTLPLPSAGIIRQLDLSHRLLISSHQCTVFISRWSDDCDAVRERDTRRMRTHLEELEEMYTTIHALRVIGPYILVLKTRSVEIHPFPSGLFAESRQSNSLPILRHHFQTYNFRNFHLADLESRQESYALKFFASDVIQGLFLFRATVTVPSDSGSEPTLNVETLFVYPMVPGIPVRRPRPPQDHAVSTGVEVQSHERLVLDTGHVRSPFFISACALGPQSMRGIWIERRRGVMDKNILTCRFTPEAHDGDDEEPGDIGMPLLLSGQVVHTLRSFDLNEDLMHCAFGEVGGCIVLGNRSGDVLLLDIGA